MKNKEVLQGIKQYIGGLFAERYTQDFQFYNLDHTEKLVKEIIVLSKNAGFTKDELFCLQIAGWFSDIAQLELWRKLPNDDEKLIFLIAQAGVEDIYLQGIMSLLAPKYPTEDPESLGEQLISDALHFFWSSKSFDFWAEALRQDTQLLESREVGRRESLEHLVTHMEQYDFYLPNKNVERTLAKVKNQQNIQRQLKRFSSQLRSRHSDSKSLMKIDNSEKSDRGVDTMFKITATNNQRLTSLADNKSHILITVNSIILSAIISILLRKLEDSSYLIYPTFLLLAVSLASMTFAILATRPNIPDGRFANRKQKDQSSNLLFFGNFYSMSLQEYTEGMLRMMYDKKLIYHSLIKDIYGQGIVLGKKYVLLRIAYNIFMFGLIISVVAFLIVFLMHQSTISPAIEHK